LRIIINLNFSADNATFRQAAMQMKINNNMDSSLANDNQQDSEARKKTAPARKRKTARGGRGKKAEESSAMQDNDAIEAEAARLAFAFPVSVPPPDVESEPTVAGN
jgi:hypothetical protein